MAVDLDYIAELSEELKKSDKRNSDLQRLRLDGEKKVVLRLLPPFGEAKAPWREIRKCYGVGPSGKTVVPPGQFGAEEDAIEQERARLEATGEDTDKKRANNLRPKKRYQAFVVVRGQEDEGPFLWEFGVEVLKDLVRLFNDPEYGDISHPKTGVDLTVDYFPGKKKDNGSWEKRPETSITPKRESTELGIDDVWLEEDLFEKWRVLRPSDNDYIRAVLEGTEREFIERKRAEREAKELADVPPPSTNDTPPSDADSVKEQLEKLKAEGKLEMDENLRKQLEEKLNG